ncbi:hypothetical protein SKAU_G00428850 [Synaphobranchus kaupii]|uniref:Uncharacterized protein n=1 Tax=Synaphobranchus kaupii TaxID=118154 RepID=A0A9Q1E4J7_SYNKA|nr:hypothetical protein SKAU_G00428850 [Synaphobranchus kaupii]
MHASFLFQIKRTEWCFQKKCNVDHTGIGRSPENGASNAISSNDITFLVERRFFYSKTGQEGKGRRHHRRAFLLNVERGNTSRNPHVVRPFHPLSAGFDVTRKPRKRTVRLWPLGTEDRAGQRASIKRSALTEDSQCDRVAWHLSSWRGPALFQ